MTDQPFDDILSDALQRLSQGAAVEECLATYPAHAAELGPLLLTAQGAIAAAAAPRPEARRVILERLTTSWQEREALRSRRWMPWNAPVRRAWAIALVAVLALVFTGWTTTAAAEDSIPGDALYNVKTAQERLVLAVTPSDHRRAQLHARYAEKRTQEMVALVRQRHDPVRVEWLVQRVSRHTRRAVVLVDAAAPPPQYPTTAQGTPSAEQRVDPALNNARVAVLRLLLHHQRLQEIGMRDLSPDKRARFQRSFQRVHEELGQAITTMRALEVDQRQQP